MSRLAGLILCAWCCLRTGLALAEPPSSAAPAVPAAPADPGEATEPEDQGPSKKELWLQDKQARDHRRRGPSPRPAARALTVLSLRNLWTGEVLPVAPGPDPAQETWDRFLRCHHTNQTIDMDRRLLGLLRACAGRFNSRFIEVVSGFRAPKYNLMLRKKGHGVARDSQHTYGHAIDFRVAGVPIQRLRRYVMAHRLGGVGYYPKSQFIHADTGPYRTWTE